MSNIAKNILEKVGGTPLVEISSKLNKGGADGLHTLYECQLFGQLGCL